MTSLHTVANQTIHRGILYDGDTTRSIDVSLKDKLSDFFSELNNENSTVVRKVERIVSDQRDEIDLLLSRVEALSRQLERQKEYYTKREDILKEMYEEELKLIENAYEMNSMSRHLHSCQTQFPNISLLQNMQPSHPPSGSSSMSVNKINKTKSFEDTAYESSYSNVSTQIEVTKPVTVDATTSPIQTRSYMVSKPNQTSPCRVRSVDVACLTRPLEDKTTVTRSAQSAMFAPLHTPEDETVSTPEQSTSSKPITKALLVDIACATDQRNEMVAKGVQSDLILFDERNDRTVANDYKTCKDESPLKFAGSALECRMEKELEGDEALFEVEKMHEKTKHLYGKLKAVMKRFPRDKDKIPALVSSQSYGKIQLDKAKLKPLSNANDIFSHKTSKIHYNLSRIVNTSHRKKPNNANRNARKRYISPLLDSSSTEISDHLFADHSDHDWLYPGGIGLQYGLMNTGFEDSKAGSTRDTNIVRKCDDQRTLLESASHMTIVRNPTYVPQQNIYTSINCHDSTLNSDVSTIQTMTCGSE